MKKLILIFIAAVFIGHINKCSSDIWCENQMLKAAYDYLQMIILSEALYYWYCCSINMLKWSQMLGSSWIVYDI